MTWLTESLRFLDIRRTLRLLAPQLLNLRVRLFALGVVGAHRDALDPKQLFDCSAPCSFVYLLCPVRRPKPYLRADSRTMRSCAVRLFALAWKFLTHYASIHDTHNLANTVAPNAVEAESRSRSFLPYCSQHMKFDKGRHLGLASTLRLHELLRSIQDLSTAITQTPPCLRILGRK